MYALVSAGDPYLLSFALERFPKWDKDDGYFTQLFRSLTQKAVVQTVVVQIHPKKPRDAADLASSRLQKMQPLSPQLLRSLPQLVKERKMLDAEYKIYVAKQLQILQSEINRNYETRQLLLAALADEPMTGVVEKLRDADPTLRWVGIELAAKKWMPLESELIELLADPFVEVRDAARQALTRLSRGNDFGPLPTATAAQVTQAQSKWQSWLALQAPPPYRDDHDN